MNTGKGIGTSYRLYVKGIPDDFGGGYISYRCPQAVEEIQCFRSIKKHCMVQMSRFPLDRLPQVLLPIPQCDVCGDAAEWIAVYYALLRFLDRVGTYPVIVFTSNAVMASALDEKTGDGPPDCEDWYNAILNIKWLGVSFQWVAEDVVERMLRNEGRRI